MPADIKPVEGNVVVDDKVKLKEIELQTEFEMKYLSESFSDLKEYVKERLDAEDEKFSVLNKKVNWLILVAGLVLAGGDLERILSVLRVLV